jgi:hypothetical protein
MLSKQHTSGGFSKISKWHEGHAYNYYYYYPYYPLIFMKIHTSSILSVSFQKPRALLFDTEEIQLYVLKHWKEAAGLFVASLLYKTNSSHVLQTPMHITGYNFLENEPYVIVSVGSKNTDHVDR